MTVALVTGAGRGIGRAIALALAADGMRVAVADLDEASAESVAAEVRAAGGSAAAFGASVTDFDASRAMVACVERTLGPVDVLASTVGAPSSGKKLLYTPVEELDALFRINVLATLVLCQAVLPGMRTRGQGAIVVISALAAQLTLPKSGPYTITKQGLETLAYTLAKEEASYGVRVNVVAPGEIDTPMGREVRARLLRHRLGREPREEELTEGMARPEAVADAVRFLVSPAAAFVSAQRLNVVGYDLAVRGATDRPEGSLLPEPPISPAAPRH